MSQVIENWVFSAIKNKFANSYGNVLRRLLPVPFILRSSGVVAAVISLCSRCTIFPITSFGLNYNRDAVGCRVAHCPPSSVQSSGVWKSFSSRKSDVWVSSSFDSGEKRRSSNSGTPLLRWTTVKLDANANLAWLSEMPPMGGYLDIKNLGGRGLPMGGFRCAACREAGKRMDIMLLVQAVRGRFGAESFCRAIRRYMEQRKEQRNSQKRDK